MGPRCAQRWPWPQTCLPGHLHGEQLYSQFIFWARFKEKPRGGSPVSAPPPPSRPCGSPSHFSHPLSPEEDRGKAQRSRKPTSANRKSPFGSHHSNNWLRQKSPVRAKTGGGGWRNNGDIHMVSECLPTRYRLSTNGGKRGTLLRQNLACTTLTKWSALVSAVMSKLTSCASDTLH